MQIALDQLWKPFHQLFAKGPDEPLLIDARIIPDLRSVHVEWSDTVVPFLESCSLVVPENAGVPAMRQSADAETIESLIAELQQVSRIAPGAAW
jgi:1,2-phenylacetyl-CoA epoxidase catalytic subunit